jgi:methionyl aminopeptidase
VSDISSAIQGYAEINGYSVVREYVGHGIGTKMHEPPEVPNYVQMPRNKPDPRLLPGMTIAIEPMVNAGAAAIRVLSDSWTVVTADGSNSAHYENTILITESEPEILTIYEGTA